MTYKYEITSAALQLGHKPPYTLINLAVRMNGDMPQVWIHEEWTDFPREGPRPEAEGRYGLPFVGITSDWRIAS